MPTLREEFIQFFEEKKKGIFLCPVCASHVFNLNVIGGVAGGMSDPATLSLLAGPYGSHQYHALSCTNCGYTAFMHTSAFSEWKAKREQT